MGDFYDVFKLVHVLAAMTWFGAGVFTQYVAARYLTASDEVAVAYAETGLASGNKFFAPAAVTTLVFGVLTVIAGDLSFGDAWISIGLAGIFISIFTGALLIGKATEGLLAAIREGGAGGSTALAARSRLRAISAVDTVVILVVTWAMVFKPGA